MEKILISIIIPTYRPQEYLWECLDSLCRQSLPYNKYEIIIVLNGEREPFETSILSYIQSHPHTNIVYRYTQESGVSNARNIGLEIAQGDYIGFIDDDDYVSPSYLKELYEKSDRTTIGLSYPYAFDDSHPEIQLKYPITMEFDRCSKNGRQSYLIPKKFFSGPCMKLIPRDIIGERRFDIRFKNGEDSIFMFLISDKMQYVDFTSNNAIYFRRFRQNSATTTNRPISKILDNCWQRFKENSRIYFSNIGNYRFRRYIMTILGLCHIILSEVIIAKIMEKLKIRN